MLWHFGVVTLSQINTKTAMMKYLALALFGLTMVSGAHRISSIVQSGSWIYLYDEAGKKYKTLSATSVGEVLSVTGDTFTSRHRSWIYTWDRNGKKVNTRAAR